MKKLILILTICLLSITGYTQDSYICVDNTGKEFSITTTQNTYNIVFDNFMIVTTLDTVISTEYYCKYIPCSNLKDTMTIYKDGLISFSTNRPTTFVIIRQMYPEEISNLYNNKKYVTIKSD